MSQRSNGILNYLIPFQWCHALYAATMRAWQRSTPGLRAKSLHKVHHSVTFDTKHSGSISIGENVRICQGVILATFGGSISIEDNVYVGPYSVLYGHGGLKIGKNTLIAAQCVIIPANHQFDRTDVPIRQQGEDRCGIAIGEDCWLGAGVKILDGVEIGAGAVIAAGAVVTRSIPAMGVAAGVPARVLRTRNSGDLPDTDFHEACNSNSSRGS